MGAVACAGAVAVARAVVTVACRVAWLPDGPQPTTPPARTTHKAKTGTRLTPADARRIRPLIRIQWQRGRDAEGAGHRQPALPAQDDPKHWSKRCARRRCAKCAARW